MKESTAIEAEARAWLADRGKSLDAHDTERALAAMALARGRANPISADRDLLAETELAVSELVTIALRVASAADEDEAPQGRALALAASARNFAQRGIDLGELRVAQRRLQDELWLYWMGDITARIDDVELVRAVLAISWRSLSNWASVQSERLSVIYQEERDRWVRRGYARRVGLVESLLGGARIDVDQADVTLGYHLRRVHTGLVLWVDPGAEEADDVLARLDDTATRLAAVLEGKLLTVAAGNYALWVWVGMKSPPSEEAWAALAEEPLGPMVQATAGRPARGVSGFRATHADAQLARNLAEGSAHPPTSVLRYSNVELAALVASDRAAMSRMVSRELGPLSADDEQMGRLRETTRVYLECGANAREASERLHLHKNTVHYRLAQIEEYLGHPIEERRLPLEIALLLVHTLGVEAASTSAE